MHIEKVLLSKRKHRRKCFDSPAEFFHCAKQNPPFLDSASIRTCSPHTAAPPCASACQCTSQCARVCVTCQLSRTVLSKIDCNSSRLGFQSPVPRCSTHSVSAFLQPAASHAYKRHACTHARTQAHVHEPAHFKHDNAGGHQDTRGRGEEWVLRACVGVKAASSDLSARRETDAGTTQS